MAIRVMSLCWEIPLDPPSKLALLALADHANEQGRSVYPGNHLLSRKVGLKIRQTQNLLAHLESHGFIRREKYAKGGRGHAVEWSVNVHLLRLLETVQWDAPLSGNHALCAIKGCTVVRETMHWAASQPSLTIMNRAKIENEKIVQSGETPSQALRRIKNG